MEKLYRMMGVMASVLIGGLLFGLLCNAGAEQWEAKRSRIEEQPLLIHETRGNWYLKQKYYKEARAVYEQIRVELTASETSEAQFRKAVELHQANLAKFYMDIGFAQGEVDGMLRQIEQQMKDLRERTGQLNEAERKLITDIELKKKSLELLKKEFSTVDALSEALSTAMQTMEGKIQEAHNLEQRSWETVQAIAAEINDRKAEQMKLEVETNLKNLQNIKQYLSGDLLSFLQRKIQENETHIGTIRDKAEDLRTRGVELSKKVDERKTAALKKDQAPTQCKLPEPPAEKPGFFTRAWRSFVGGIKSFGTWFLDLFGSSKPEQKPVKAVSHQQSKA